MKERTVSTLKGLVTIDQCEHCKGMWFDNGEAEILKTEWMSEYLDSGDPTMGKAYNAIRNINCPRCNNAMLKKNDADQPHILYEVCSAHGIFMDAAEFTDYKYETLVDMFKSVVSNAKAILV